VTGLIVPRVKFDGRVLRRRNQALDTVDLDIRLAVAFYLRDRDKVRHAAHLMALKRTGRHWMRPC